MVAVRKLEPPDLHHLNAAVGWLELGKPAESRIELDRIAPEHRTHPAVLDVRWRICAVVKDWLGALDAAERLIDLDPKNPCGWINQSYSLHELGMTAKALDRLLPVAEKFPSNAFVHYNLACYACQLGNLQDARSWLEAAIRIKGRKRIRQMALSDPDLKPLWGEILKF